MLIWMADICGLCSRDPGVSHCLCPYLTDVPKPMYRHPGCFQKVPSWHIVPPMAAFSTKGRWRRMHGLVFKLPQYFENIFTCMLRMLRMGRKAIVHIYTASTAFIYKLPHHWLKLTLILTGNFSISNANYIFFTFKFCTTCFGQDILGSATAFNHNFN